MLARRSRVEIVLPRGHNPSRARLLVLLRGQIVPVRRQASTALMCDTTAGVTATTYR